MNDAVLRQLVHKWRDPDYCIGVDDCADELEAALAAPPGSLGHGKSGEDGTQLSLPDLVECFEHCCDLLELFASRAGCATHANVSGRGHMVDAEDFGACAALDDAHKLIKAYKKSATPSPQREAMAGARPSDYAEEPGLLTEVEALRALLQWVQDKSHEAMWTMPGTKQAREIRDQCLSEICSKTKRLPK